MTQTPQCFWTRRHFNRFCWPYPLPWVCTLTTTSQCLSRSSGTSSVRESATRCTGGFLQLVPYRRWCQSWRHVGYCCCVVDFTVSLELPAYAGSRVHFVDVARSCAKYALQRLRSGGDTGAVEIPESHNVTRKWRELKNKLATNAIAYEARHVFGALTILDTFRTFRFRRCALRSCAIWGPCRLFLCRWRWWGLWLWR